MAGDASWLIVSPTRMVDNRTLAQAGHGTQGARNIVRTHLVTEGFDVHDEILGSLIFDWNQESKELLRKLPRKVFVRAPREPIPNLPRGFRSDPSLAEQTRHHWEPFERKAWADMHRHSAQHGLPCGLVCHYVTNAGGHLPTVKPSIVIAREHFSNALHLGTYFLPTDDRKLWTNLRQYRDYPDDLEIPLLMADNRHRELLDRVVPIMMALLISGQRYVDRGQHSLLENFAYLTRLSPLLGIAAAQISMPVVQVGLMGRLRGHQPGVAEQEVLPKIAELIVKVLQPTAKLLDCDDPDPDDAQFLAIGGMPVPRNNDTWLHTREDFKQRVGEIVTEKLAQQQQSMPPGLTAIWASTVERTDDGFIHVPAIRIFPIRGRTARDFIDAMLATDRSPNIQPLPRRVLSA